MIKLHDLHFEPYLSEEEIQKAIQEISLNLNKDYKGQKPIFLVVLNGAFMFASEVMKQFEDDCEISFVKLASYDGEKSTGAVKTLIGLKQSLQNRKVVILEDIVDTGNTLEELVAILKKENVSEFKVATLFYKPEAYKKSIPVDYVGLEIPNKFIVGFGLDYDELGRNLTQVYQRKD